MTGSIKSRARDGGDVGFFEKMLGEVEVGGDFALQVVVDVDEEVEGAERRIDGDSGDFVEVVEAEGSAFFKCASHLLDDGGVEVEGGDGSELGEGGGVAGDLVLEVGHGGGDLGVGNGVADAPAGHGVALGAAEDRDGGFGVFGAEAGDAGVGVSVEEQFVYFVADDPEAVFEGEVGDLFG